MLAVGGLVGLGLDRAIGRLAMMGWRIWKGVGFLLGDRELCYGLGGRLAGCQRHGGAKSSRGFNEICADHFGLISSGFEPRCRHE
jgi:hypothetical protein